MTTIVNIVLATGALAVALPGLVYTVECFAALLPRARREGAAAQKPRVAVLIPAHNEASEIGRTLGSILAQTRDGDRVIVIADNCEDSTAEIARGVDQRVEVLERRDDERRGKGFALDFGLRSLESDPPDIVIMFDADGQISPGGIDALAAQAARTGRPAQAVYLMETPASPSPRDAVSALAFLVKNLVRPTGLVRLGAPVLLTGTGMAFPWAVIRKAPMASGNIVEDMQLGLDLAVAGHAPLLCEDALVTGSLPAADAAATSQRTRWEHGHLRTLVTQTPRLVGQAVRQGRPSLLALAAEVAVPPLSLLAAAMLGVFIVGSLAAAAGAWAQPAISAFWTGVLVLLATGVAWWRFGRDRIPASALLAAPKYILWKIPLYAKFVFDPQRTWVRTAREAETRDARPRSAEASPSGGGAGAGVGPAGGGGA